MQTASRPEFPKNRFIREDDDLSKMCRECKSSIHRIFDFFFIQVRDPQGRCVNPECNNHHPKHSIQATYQPDLPRSD